ncbi:MAG: glycoside hydrolase family 3 C-terminal domain-containing protein, partial [Clostridia bacterium]|nr:glycoside hydrolase family 3 C-terminal domain-containing protein [Clostridia bacterium]
KIAHDIAAESMVLLKNNGILPLDKEAKICLAGSISDDKKTVLGAWSYADTSRTVTIKEGMQKAGKIVDFCGSGIPYEMQRHFRNSDIIVLAIGESRDVTGEARSLANLELAASEKELVYTAHRFGKKVVGVLCCGRPIALESVEPYFDAILYAWHGGSGTGLAVADILFGNICPSGKTAVTFPRVTGQVPIYYNVPSCGKPADGYYSADAVKNYEDCLGSPMYPFGYGLSYTEFEYSEPKADVLEISRHDLKNGKKFLVSALVTNTGGCDGKEAAQCYIQDIVSKMTRPIRELKGFEKVFIKKGETKTVTFKLGFDELGCYGADGKFDVESGEFDIFIGKNCLETKQIRVKVTE